MLTEVFIFNVPPTFSLGVTVKVYLRKYQDKTMPFQAALQNTRDD